MESVIPDSIAHLDFDIEKAKPCNGVYFYNTRTGEVNIFNRCKEPADFSVVTVCCGKVRLYCMNCLNTVIKRIYSNAAETKPTIHRDCGNEFGVPPFINITPL